MTAAMTALWTSEEAARATGAATDRPWRASGVSIDTRRLEAGDLFVALKGPNFDGHDFVAAASGNGAAAAVVSRDFEAGRGTTPLLRVDDTTRALRDLGKAARARCPAKRIAITGSVGKTGTKEAVRCGLAPQGRTYASAGNLNNAYGVPLSLSRLPRDSEYAVFELGMNHGGEISELTRMVAPNIAVITTIEPVHLEFFQSIAGVADAKAEIFEGMTGGTAVLNRENPFFHYLSEKADRAGIARILSFGAHPDADARLHAYRSQEFAGEAGANIGSEIGSEVEAVVMGSPLRYAIGLPGRHSALNSLAALAAIHAAGGDIETAAAHFATLSPLQGRGARQRLRLDCGPVTLIDETYNASPAATRAALQVFGDLAPEGNGRRIFVLGDMLELGPEAERLHRALARDISAAQVARVFTVGPLAASLMADLPADKRARAVEQAADLAEPLLAELQAGDIVLIKGSAGVALHRLRDALLSASRVDRPVRDRPAKEA